MNTIIDIIISANCPTLNSTWTNVVTEPALPAQHGIKLTLNCPENYTNNGGNTATCQDGNLVLTNGPPDCRGE